MKSTTIGNDMYLEKIYEQNLKIIELLERLVPPSSLTDAEEEGDQVKRDNMEKVKSLSPRERQIVELVLEGKMNKQIAHDLKITVSTVEAHRSNIMRKLGVTHIAHMIKIYLQAQL